MDLFAIKLTLTPLLIGASTLAGRRWGPAIGGLIAGLPLTAAPISVFLAFEQGQSFAAESAVSALLGYIGVGAFCLAYRLTLPGARPWSAAITGMAAFLAASFFLSFVTVGALTAAVIVVILLAPVLAVIKRLPFAIPALSPAWWDMPSRMIIATVMVLAITGGAHLLGPEWSGLLSPFPVFTSVMAVFAHQASGWKAAHQLLRGVVLGCFAAAAFFLTVALLLKDNGIWMTYSLAVVAALAVNSLALLEIVRNKRAAQ
jgi:hypothetical protein